MNGKDRIPRISRLEFYETGICRTCHLEQRTRDWHRRAGPRCYSCGGLLDRKYLRLADDQVVINPNVSTAR